MHAHIITQTLVEQNTEHIHNTAYTQQFQFCALAGVGFVFVIIVVRCLLPLMA